ncbi:MAG: D-alanine--D-alanine ligase [Bacteroidales bacterium]|nr:D-alanine--D-alanine ligase [Bacteroidales bacterium]
MKKRVALIYGGYSSEWEVSVKSGKNVFANIDPQRYDAYEVLLRPDGWRVLLPEGDAEIDRSDFSFLRKGERVRFDKAFIMIHGTPGENGLLQGYFELLGIPHTGCSAMTSTLAFDKFACKTYLKEAGILLAKDHFLRKGDGYSPQEIVDKLGLPLFVKPNQGGSSFGITKVKRVEDLDAAIELAFREDDSVLIEDCITGRELTMGIYMEGAELRTLPATEIIPHNEYFDYEAKYMGASQEVCPADVPQEIYDKIAAATKRIYRRFGCHGLVRMDYILKGNDPYFLEINPIPGMTDTSLVPQQVRAAGIDMKDFISNIIDN